MPQTDTHDATLPIQVRPQYGSLIFRTVLQRAHKVLSDQDFDGAAIDYSKPGTRSVTAARIDVQR